jgi:hypothetical protein
MRRLTFAASLFLAALPFCGVVPACNGSAMVDNADADAGDAAIPPDQPLGFPCDPTLPEPCLAPAPCYSVTCDIVQGCTQSFTGCPAMDASSPFDFEAGAEGDSSVPGLITCSTTNDCPGLTNDAGVIVTHTEVCGFPIIEGCAATGVCVVPQPPMHPNGTVYTGCACFGDQSVPYVSDNYTSAPVQTGGTPCPVDSGPVGSEDAALEDGGVVDASVDGSVDGSVSDANPGDAASDASADDASNVIDSSMTDAPGD